MLAVVYRELDERDAAIACAKNALAIAPTDDNAHYLLGLLYRDALRFDLARKHFTRAMELAPERESAARARTGLKSLPPAGRTP